VRVEPLRDTAGIIVGTLGLGVDVTARERAAAALRDSEARFRAIFEHAAIGIGLSDLDRRPLMVNPALARFTGYDGVKEMHRPIPQTTHPDDLVQDRALYAVQFTRQVDRQGYVRFRRWRVYGERGLAGAPIAVWVYDGALRLAYQTVQLAAYAVALHRDGRRIREVKSPRLAATRFRSPQLALFELGPDEWLLYLRLPEYALRHGGIARGPVQLPLLLDAPGAG